MRGRSSSSFDVHDYPMRGGNLGGGLSGSLRGMGGGGGTGFTTSSFSNGYNPNSGFGPGNQMSGNNYNSFC